METARPCPIARTTQARRTARAPSGRLGGGQSRFSESAVGGSAHPTRAAPGRRTWLRASRTRKTLEEFDFTFQRSVKKTVVEHLGQLDFLHARENVILLGPRPTR